MHLQRLLLFAALGLALSACEEEPPPPDDDDVADDDDATDDDDSATDDDDSATDDDDSAAVDPIHLDHEPGCDDLNPRVCILPWPSDAFLAVDPETLTGFHVEYTPESVPHHESAPELDPAEFRILDGHSPASQLMTMFDAPPDLGDAAGATTIERSLGADSPTVLLDLVTGERVAHWVELDAQADSPKETVVYVRPADVLSENRSYAMALRGLVDGGGEPFGADPAFEALRDDVLTDNAPLEARRARAETAFAALEAAGVARAELQQMWTFHTASGEALRGDLLSIRADALERLGPDGLGCSITSIEQDYAADAYRRVRGTFTVPSYTDSPTAPARFVRGPDGRPEFVEMREVAFTAIVPESVGRPADGDPVPRPLVTFGHGLLGEAEGTVSSDRTRALADQAAMVVIGTDWAGMSQSDLLAVAAALQDPNQFIAVTDRMQQGMVNFIAMGRTFAGICREHEAFVVDDQPLISADEHYYVGGSQGGILGATLLTIHPDIERGLLVVNGAAFSFMMDRSIAFSGLLSIFEGWYPVRTDRAILLTLAQQLWDFAEPTSYLPYATSGMEDFGPKTLLSIAALNDAQVPNLSTDLAMRMADVPVIAGSVREPWGIDVVQAPWDGSGYITIDVGDPPNPEGNVAPTEDAGGHGDVILAPSAMQIVTEFLTPDGLITMPCDGVCDPD